jgi:hypothetical protein
MTPNAQKLVAVSVLALAGAAAIGILRRPASEPTSSAETNDEEARPAAKSPRLVLGRPWFDTWPKKRSDVVDLWIFFGGGIGLEDKGSIYRSTMDFFELERQGSRLEIVWLQDKSKQTVSFEVVECHDKPPFDLCLELKQPLRGKTKLYSWDDDADMDRHVPWAREWRASAEARAKAQRP